MNKKCIALGVILFMFNCAGTRPTNLGVKNGKLLACPTDKPNCVLSQAEPSDSHYIAPFKYNTDLPSAFAELKSVIEKQERAKIINVSDNYLNAEFTSRIMGYVDDVEFYFEDNTKTIHVRSASRLGTKDFGVNRKRIESIREQLKL
jgi:uncharacterized protein (DUF1499 family)